MDKIKSTKNIVFDFNFYKKIWLARLNIFKKINRFKK
jgi:hypothetical protein